MGVCSEAVIRITMSCPKAMAVIKAFPFIGPTRSATAKAAGQKKLIMRPREWHDIILPYLIPGDFNSFRQDITDRIDGDQSIEELNKWLPLAVNIWNNTPQPDRGGKTAFEQSPSIQNDNDVTA